MSLLFTTTLGLEAVGGALSTTVLPEDVDTVLELLLTVLETVDEVTVSVAKAGNEKIRSPKYITFFETAIVAPF